MLYSVEVKAGNQRIWRRLSVKMRSIGSLKLDLEQYAIMYAEDRQINYHSVMARIVDENNNIVYFRDSNANANKA